jgi:hypothetical protein
MYTPQDRWDHRAGVVARPAPRGADPVLDYLDLVRVAMMANVSLDRTGAAVQLAATNPAAYAAYCAATGLTK